MNDLQAERQRIVSEIATLGAKLKQTEQLANQLNIEIFKRQGPG